MDRMDANELLARIVEGTATEKEQDLVNSWYLKYKEETTLDLTAEDYEAAELLIYSKLPGVIKPKALISRFRWWSAAAAVALIFLSIGFFFMKKEQPENFVSTAKHKNDVMPGDNRATLTLADGSIIELEAAANGEIASEPGMVVTKTSAGHLSYKLTAKGDRTAGTNTITTPYGGKYEIVLQDGTSVMLNAGSSLTYPLSFSGRQRRVSLTGEAYFEVAKDKTKPFIVETPANAQVSRQEVQVLGTHFNICAYPDEYSYVTTLLEGSVRVSAGLDLTGKVLTPGQQSSVIRSVGVRTANVEQAVAWKNDLFYFRNEPLHSVMRKLARWYDVEIEYNEDVHPSNFWGQISRSKKLSEVLDAVETTAGVHFKIEGRRVVIMK